MLLSRFRPASTAIKLSGRFANIAFFSLVQFAPPRVFPPVERYYVVYIQIAGVGVNVTIIGIVPLSRGNAAVVLAEFGGDCGLQV